MAKNGYAIIDGRIATIYKGRRCTFSYRSGEKLRGRLLEREDGML